MFFKKKPASLTPSAANSQICAALATPDEARDHEWRHQFYQIIKGGLFAFAGMITDGNGRGYVGVYVVDEADENTKAFEELARYAFECEAGIAVLDHQSEEGEAPLEILRFGAIWSYVVYGELAGNPDVMNDYAQALKAGHQNPFEAEVSDSNKALTGSSTEEFFPLPVRDMIMGEVQEIAPDANVNFQLWQQERYAMPSSIQVIVKPELTDAQKEALSRQFAWYSTPYLPIGVQ